MSEKNIDVDLEALLADESKPITDLGASDQKSETSPKAEEATVRENERIRELVEKNKRLEESLNLQNSSELDKFINSIDDEPSRNLLKTYAELSEKKLNQRFTPVLDDFHKSKFEKEFSQYADKIPDLQAHKDEIWKNYQRKPDQGVKALVSETLLDIQTSKVKPIDNSASIASRSAPEVDSNTSKEDLYAILESRPSL